MKRHPERVNRHPAHSIVGCGTACLGQVALQDWGVGSIG